MKRFKDNREYNKLFNLLDRKQMSDRNKIKLCDHVVVNEKNLII